MTADSSRVHVQGPLDDARLAALQDAHGVRAPEGAANPGAAIRTALNWNKVYAWHLTAAAPYEKPLPVVPPPLTDTPPTAVVAVPTTSATPTAAPPAALAPSAPNPLSSDASSDASKLAEYVGARYGGSRLPVVGGLGVVAAGAVVAKAWPNGRKPSAGLERASLYQSAQVSDA